MNAQQLFNSLAILQKILELKLPVKKAYSIYSLEKQVAEYKKFFIIEEEKLIKKFKVQIDEDGNLKFNNENEKSQFMKEHNELMECEIELQSVELAFDDVQNIKFTAQDLAMLEGIINFID